LTTEDFDVARPVYAVWEVTRHCDQPCQHCGSRAGPKLDDELSTEETLEVARALARLGCRECALIGGEAYLRKDLPRIIEELVEGGVRVVMQTGGRGLSPERARTLKAAGLSGVGVSIDGLGETHDTLRGNTGSFDAALRALNHARDAGLVITANTQINRLNLGELEKLSRLLRDEGVSVWQVQLTVPMGHAADRPEWLLQPWQMIDVVETLAAIQSDAIAEHTEQGREGPIFNVFANNNVGYFGPHEEILRSTPGGISAHWHGCRAGINLVGIEADGVVKACPSLPTIPYDGGNVRELTLDHLWEHSERVRFARDRDVDELWGFCESCYYADTCRAGCSWTTHCLLGKRGNNPWCYHRATQLRRRGLRERLVQVERAPNTFFDFGRFELVEEPWTDDEDAPPPRRLPLLD
jgi:radical SAM protein with 4Fe4S-binding SPASM domain